MDLLVSTGRFLFEFLGFLFCYKVSRGTDPVRHNHHLWTRSRRLSEGEREEGNTREKARSRRESTHQGQRMKYITKTTPDAPVASGSDLQSKLSMTRTDTQGNKEFARFDPEGSLSVRGRKGGG